MADNKKIKTALVSVYHKENLDGIIKRLNELGVKINQYRRN
jgi:phosphoribosylaminoimidazolecarboxamide formyltransferase / IMP cyclohydrolase